MPIEIGRIQPGQHSSEVHLTDCSFGFVKIIVTVKRRVNTRFTKRVVPLSQDAFLRLGEGQLVACHPSYGEAVLDAAQKEP